MPKVWALLWDQLDDSMKENAKLLETKQYMERNWVPTSLPLQKNATKFDVLMTNHFDTVDRGLLIQYPLLSLSLLFCSF